MDTFTITAYNAATDVVTFNATVNGTTYTGIKTTGCPKDSVASVKAFFRAYADSYQAGKNIEANKVSNFPPEVTALLNVPTAF